MIDTRSSLLVRVRDPGDQQSWTEFHRLYRPLLQAYVRRAGLSDADADDVVQMIFERLLQTLPGFSWDRSRGRFRTWLWQVMHNAVVDWRRRTVRRERVEQAATAERRESGLPEEPDSWRNDLRLRVLERGLEIVRQRTQQQTWACFQRHLLEGRPSADVATELSLTINQVNVNSSRVLARVRDQCRDFLQDLDEDVEIQL